MTSLWNKKVLDRPPNNTSTTENKKFVFQQYLPSLEKILKDLKHQDLLYIEAAVLSRLIYRMKSKFRNDKGLKNMEKMNRALLNYLVIDLHKEIVDLKNFVETDGPNVTLPTRQMIEYILVRMQGFAKLMCRIENVAQCSAQFFLARISIGHAWTLSVLAYAVISRVWYLSKYLAKRCCDWYNTLHTYICQFEYMGSMWLPNDYEFPTDLKSWLDVPWIDEPLDSATLQDDGRERIFSLIKSKSENLNDSNFEIEAVDSSSEIDISLLTNTWETDQKDSQHETESSVAKQEVSSFFTDDIGTSVDRESFKLTTHAEVQCSPEKTQAEVQCSSEKTQAEVQCSSEKTHVEVECSPEKSDTQNLNESKGNLKRRNEGNKSTLKTDLQNLTEISPQSKAKKPKLTVLEDINLLVDQISPPISKIQLKKSKYLEIGKRMEHGRLIESRQDVIKFLRQKIHPRLTGMGWYMLQTLIKNLLTKLDSLPAHENTKYDKLITQMNHRICRWIKSQAPNMLKTSKNDC